jgi:hypothetical protein
VSAESERLVLCITSEDRRYFVKVEGEPTVRGLRRLRKHLELLEHTLGEEEELATTGGAS